jgi:hypothetical protein
MVKDDDYFDHNHSSSGESDPFASWSDESSSDSTDSENARSQKAPLEQAMMDTESILDHLICLGMAIRTSGTVSRLRKADVNFTIRDYQHLEDEHYEHSHQVDIKDLRALKTHLMTILFAHPSQVVKDEPQDGKKPLDFTSALEKLEEVHRRTIEQLIFANLRRRNRFAYAKRHAEKLAAREEASYPEEMKFATEESVLNPTRNAEQVTSLEEVPNPIPENKPALILPSMGLVSETSPSEGIVDPRALKQTAPSQKSMSRMSVSFEKLGWPHPPPVNEKRGSFRCPCCYQTLSKRESEQRLWR